MIEIITNNKKFIFDKKSAMLENVTDGNRIFFQSEFRLKFIENLFKNKMVTFRQLRNIKDMKRFNEFIYYMRKELSKVGLSVKTIRGLGYIIEGTKNAEK